MADTPERNPSYQEMMMQRLNQQRAAQNKIKDKAGTAKLSYAEQGQGEYDPAIHTGKQFKQFGTMTDIVLDAAGYNKKNYNHYLIASQGDKILQLARDVKAFEQLHLENLKEAAKYKENRELLEQRWNRSQTTKERQEIEAQLSSMDKKEGDRLGRFMAKRDEINNRHKEALTYINARPQIQYFISPELAGGGKSVEAVKDEMAKITRTVNRVRTASQSIGLIAGQGRVEMTETNRKIKKKQIGF